MKENNEGTIIETQNLKLRKLNLNDFKSWNNILSDEETMRYYPKPFDEQKTLEWIDWTLESYRRYNFGLWAIILKENNLFIGDCGITMQDVYGNGNLFPEIGYHLDKNFWNNGYATEAASSCLKFAFKNFNFSEIFCYQHSENIASRKVAEKIGMSLRKKNYKKDVYTSIYSITSNEFKNNFSSF